MNVTTIWPIRMNFIQISQYTDYFSLESEKVIIMY